MWAADGNVHWLARLAGSALGFASGRRGPHQASSAAAIFPVEMEDGICFLRCPNSQLHSLKNLTTGDFNICSKASSIIRFSGHCWYLCIYYTEAGNVLRSGGNWSMWSGIWHSQTVYSVKWSDGIKSEDRLFMRRLSEYLHCQHEINSRTMIHVC